jgi:ADP-ribose pyrophosphatase YjhB (NUDIX family)
MEKQWIRWARELQSISQAGLSYSKNDYDLDRYREIEKLSQEIIKKHTNELDEVIKEYYQKEDGYLTPKVDVRGCVIVENKILLVKEKIDGCWSLPGGWADVNRSPGENVMKEAFEEAGIRVNPNRIIGVLDRSRWVKDTCPYTIYKILMLCDLIEGGFIDNTETEDSQFFALDNLPILSQGRTTEEQIKLCFLAYENKNFKPIFD